MKFWKTIAIAAAAILLLSGCGSNDASKLTGADKQGQVDDTQGGPGSQEGGGTLVIDGATIELANAHCELQEEDAPAGGGKMLFSGGASGTDAEGEKNWLSVSRYGQDHMLRGDSVEVTTGSLTDPEASFAMGMFDTDGDVLALDGSTISGEDLELTHEDDSGTTQVSFEIDC